MELVAMGEAETEAAAAMELVAMVEAETEAGKLAAEPAAARVAVEMAKVMAGSKEMVGVGEARRAPADAG